MSLDQPSWPIYLSLAFFVLTFILIGRRVPGYWRRPDARLSTMPAYWVWGETAWRGFVRAIPAILVGSALVVGMTTYAVVVGPARVREDVFWLWFTLFMLSLGAWATIVLINQPKFLVPPYLRSEPGLWRGRRSRESR
jgi:hypothetical protein